MKVSNYKSILLLPLLSASSLVNGADYSYAFNTSYEVSDNLSGLQGGIEGEATTIGLNFSFGSTTYREWEVELNGSISKINYSVDSLFSETNKEIEANVLYKPLQSHFTMFSLLNIGQAPINRFETQEVNNTRDEVILAIRPLYSFPITKIDTLNIGYAYVDTKLEDVDTVQAFQISSNISSNFILNYEKSINATNRISLNLSKGKTNFDDAFDQGAIDYDQEDVFIRWVVAGQTNQLQIEYGNSKIVDERSQDLDIKLQTLSYDRQINSENSLQLSYSKSFGNALNTNQATNTITIDQQNDLNTAQIVEDYSLNFTHNGNVLTSTVGFSNTNLNQVFTDNTEKRQSFQVGIVYRLSRILNNSGQSNIRVDYEKSESDFDTVRTTIVNNEIETYNVSYNYVYSSNFTVSLIYVSRDTMQLDLNLLDTLIESESVAIRFVYGDRGRL